MNIKRATEVLKLCMRARTASLLVGHSGVGKTEIVGQLAASLYPNHEFVKIMASQQDVGDFAGIPKVKEVQDTKSKKLVTVTSWARPEWMPIKPCVLFLDEVNQAHRDVEAALFQLVDEKRIHTHCLHPDSIVIAAINPSTSEYTTANPISEAFAKRFIIIPFTPEPEEFIKWGEKSGRIHDELLRFLNFDSLHTGLQKPLDTTIKITPSPRQIERASQLFKAASVDNTNFLNNSELVTDVLLCTVGAEAAGSFLAFQKSTSKPLTFEDILNNWDTSKSQFSAYRTYNRNDLVSETVSNVYDGLVNLTATLHNKFTFKYTPALDMDDTDPKISKAARDEIEANCHKYIGKTQMANVMDFISSLPKDMFYTFSYNFATKCPFDTKDKLDNNYNRNNVHWSLFAYLWSSAFQHQNNLYKRLAAESDDIADFVNKNKNKDKK